MTAKTLERQVFKTSRETEFFTEKELQMQIGHGPQWWHIALVKELIDNALDACEESDTPPRITVNVGEDFFSVEDNGPGIPNETIAGSLDYLKRVSDKTYYVSPTRGQMGNALKTVWAAPFVKTGKTGKVEIWAQGKHHTVTVSLDRIAQRPAIEHEFKDIDRKKGTIVKVWWENSSGSQDGETRDFYKIPSVSDLIGGYALFNPHATFTFEDTEYKATDTAWQKWRPNMPTSPHWYNRRTLRDLIAAYISAEKQRTVREFVSEFRGLSSTVKQKQVTNGQSRAYLTDLVKDDDVDIETVSELLWKMKAASTPPKPAVLGIIGEDHIKRWMVEHANVSEPSVKYKKLTGVETKDWSDYPYIIEFAFGVIADDGARRRIETGTNWTPSLGMPADEIRQILGQQRIEAHDPVVVVIHMAKPRFGFSDRGKTRIEL